MIIGWGGASSGLSASINARIRIEKYWYLASEVCSPAAAKGTTKIINYPGFPPITGEDLRRVFRSRCYAGNWNNSKKRLIKDLFARKWVWPRWANRKCLGPSSVIVTTGIVHPVLSAREREFLGKGVGYCATCDGPFFGGKDVAIIAYNARLRRMPVIWPKLSSGSTICRISRKWESLIQGLWGC